MQCNPWTYLVGGAIAMILVIWLLSSGGEQSVNDQLAHTTDEALESAESAREDTHALFSAIGQYRLLTIALGTLAPIGLAGWALYLVWRRDPGELELIEQYERLSHERSSQPLPTSKRAALRRVHQRRLTRRSRPCETS